MRAYAAFDVLVLGENLSRILGGVGRGELHLFAYMSCLLFLYRGNPVTDWQYSFAATPHSAPYSLALDGAVDDAEESGFLEKTGEFYACNDMGRSELEALRQLSTLSEREMFLEAAASSALAMPPGVVRRALATEPQLNAARQLGSGRPLLDEASLGGLYEHFAALRSALEMEDADLLAPAVLWLEYLAQEAGITEEMDAS